MDNELNNFIYEHLSKAKPETALAMITFVLEQASGSATIFQRFEKLWQQSIHLNAPQMYRWTLGSESALKLFSYIWVHFDATVIQQPGLVSISAVRRWEKKYGNPQPGTVKFTKVEHSLDWGNGLGLGAHFIDKEFPAIAAWMHREFGTP